MKLNVRNRNKGTDKPASWEYRFEVAKIGGKRKQISKGGFRTKKDAENAGIKAMNEYNGTIEVSAQTLSYSDFLDYWIDCTGKTLKESSLRIYNGLIRNHIKPALGRFRLNQLSPLQIQNYINDLYASGLSASSCSSVNWIIKESLRFAVVPCGYLKYSPAEYIRTPKCANTTKKEKVIVSFEQLQPIAKKYGEYSPFYASLVIGFYTGMRKGEIFALKWTDIDLINKNIRVSASKGYKGKITTPKSENSFRDILIGNFLLNYLKELKKSQSVMKMYYGEYYNNSGFVVVKENGEPAKPNTFATKLWKDYDFTYHCLRHTHASLLADSGVDAKIVQQRLGHSDITTTLNVYTHVTEGMKQAAVDAFEKYGGRQEDKTGISKERNA